MRKFASCPSGFVEVRSQRRGETSHRWIENVPKGQPQETAGRSMEGRRLGKWLRGRSGPQVVAVICDLHIVWTPSSTFYWQAVDATPMVQCPGECVQSGPTCICRPLLQVVLLELVPAVEWRPRELSGVLWGFLPWDSRETVCIYYVGKWHNPEHNMQQNDTVGFEIYIVTRSKVSSISAFAFLCLNCQKTSFPPLTSYACY